MFYYNHNVKLTTSVTQTNKLNINKYILLLIVSKVKTVEKWQ